MAGDVDANLPHHFDGQRVESLRVGAGAVYLEVSAAEGTQESFGHLRTGGIAGAEEQDADRVTHINSLSTRVKIEAVNIFA